MWCYAKQKFQSHQIKSTIFYGFIHFIRMDSHSIICSKWNPRQTMAIKSIRISNTHWDFISISLFNGNVEKFHSIRMRFTMRKKRRSFISNQFSIGTISNREKCVISPFLGHFEIFPHENICTELLLRAHQIKHIYIEKCEHDFILGTAAAAVPRLCMWQVFFYVVACWKHWITNSNQNYWIDVARVCVCDSDNWQHKDHFAWWKITIKSTLTAECVEQASNVLITEIMSARDTLNSTRISCHGNCEYRGGTQNHS